MGGHHLLFSKVKSFFEKEKVAGFVFIGPFIIGFLSFVVLPMIVSFGLSFTRYDILSAPKWIGVDNFIRMFTDDKLFWKSFKVTIYFSVVSVPLKLIMALGVAMLFKKTTRLSAVYRAVYYLPSIMGGSMAVAVLWKRLFASDGPINHFMGLLGLPSDISWLGRVDTAIWTLIILSVWQFGSSMVIFLAGLKQIPVTLYEAAEVDGCRPVRQFFSITLPLLTPVLFFNIVQQTINSFMAFTQSYVITDGAPRNSTLFYMVYMYRRSFKYYEMGYGSAIAWFMLIVVALLTALIFKSSTKWVYRESEEN